LGNSDALRRTIRRARRKYIPDEPKNLIFSLPNKWKTTMGGESTDFLIYDNGNEYRILIFATNGCLFFFIFIKYYGSWMAHLNVPVYLLSYTLYEENLKEMLGRVFMLFFQINWKIRTMKCC